MQGVKVFIADFKTKKKAYKLLAKIVEKYEIQSGITELLELDKEVTPLVESQATKPRLRLISAYISHLKHFVEHNHLTLD